MSWVLIVAAVGLLVALQWGAVDAFLPGGRLNPYTATSVEKDHTWLRFTAHTVAVGLIVALLVAVYAIEVGHAS